MKKIILAILVFIFLPLITNAQATMSVSPSVGTYEVGEIFSTLVNLNSGGQSINAGMAQINFDNTRLEVVSLGYSQSIFSLWTENPSFSNIAGNIKFGGGVPSPGFTGASGGILRITFRAKATGQAPVNFMSGSVLANDGQGSNILDSMRGSIFTVTPATTPAKVQTPVVAPDEGEATPAPLSAPVITNWPEKLEAGDTITIEGLGHPLSKISIVLQKGNSDLIYEYTFSGPDGKFKFTYPKKAESGYYRIWAKSITDTGAESGLSIPITVEIVSNQFIRLGGVVLNYASIIVTLLALLALVLLVFAIIWWKYTHMKKARGKEIVEAEHVLHKSFDTLKDGLSQYVSYLVGAKTASGIRKRELKTKNELKQQLEDIEEVIDKEIKEIK
ncbi:MAG: cohesin domain-containing protein [Patescibacteria group bacterium]